MGNKTWLGGEHRRREKEPSETLRAPRKEKQQYEKRSVDYHLPTAYNLEENKKNR